jgi:hypothetical protein
MTVTMARTVDPQDPRTWPALPPLPRHVQARLDRLSRADRALGAVLAGRAAVTAVTDCVLAVCADLTTTATREQLAAEAAYNRAVEAHNALANAYNARLRAAAQTRLNAREAAALRATACRRCMATHPGEC